MTEAAQERVLVCRVGSERFALPIAAVRQVVAGSPVTLLPGAPEVVRGLANVQGVLVTAVSGPRLLGQIPGGPSEWLVVLGLRDGRVGIEVDEVEDVHEGSPDGLQILELDALLGPLIADRR